MACRAEWRLNQAIAGNFQEKGPICPPKATKAVSFSAKAATWESSSQPARLDATLFWCLMPRQPAFCIQGRHAAHASAGDGLPIDMVGQIACRKYAWNGRAGAARFDVHIAAVVQGQLIFYQL